MASDEDFMRAALALGEEGLERGGLPVGAVLVSNGVIVGRGSKSQGSGGGYFRHAEIEALRRGVPRERPGPLVLYSTLEPCIMCFGTALHLSVERVVYALEDPGAGATGIDLHSLPPRHRNALPRVLGGVLRREALGQMRRFLDMTPSKHWRDPRVPLVALVRSATAGWPPDPRPAKPAPVATEQSEFD